MGETQWGGDPRSAGIDQKINMEGKSIMKIEDVKVKVLEPISKPFVWRKGRPSRCRIEITDFIMEKSTSPGFPK